MNKVTENEREELFTELAALPHPPEGAVLRAWLADFPQYRKEIIDFVTAWAAKETTRFDAEPGEEEILLVGNRAMSALQDKLAAWDNPAPVADLTTEIAAAGHDEVSFEAAVGIDRLILSGLVGGSVKLASIPAKLVSNIAAALRRNADQVRAILRESQKRRPLVAYKAKGKPVPREVDFKELVAHSELEEADKARWRAEPPDPELNG